MVEHGTALETQDGVEQIEGPAGGQNEVDIDLIGYYELPRVEALPEPGKLQNLCHVGAGWGMELRPRP